MTEHTGRVYLVGAGCGTADLITLRGLALLRQCDVLVYDDLIDHALLAQVPSTAETIYAGKRSGRHSMAQAEINRILVEQAQAGKTVVRLKGGDPFVFGRGGEEILALQAQGIPFEAVPGISSAIAIPAAAGIPVTHRGLSQSVHIVTGHTASAPDGLPADLDALAQLSGTLVFLMGLSQLSAIARRLIAAGKAPDTPAAVISGGNAPHPATVRGTLETIAAQTQAAHVASPAVIVIGPVAALELSAQLPLAGVRIAITGTAQIQDKLRPALRQLGAQVLTAEVSHLAPIPCAFDFSRLASGCHWLVFTSGNGVRRFFEVLRQQRFDLRGLSRCHFAVIGAATAAALESYGFFPDLCPQSYTCEALAQALCAAPEDIETAFLFRSARGSAVLPQILSRRYAVEDIPLYDLTAETPPLTAPVDYLTFASSSAVELYFAQNPTLPSNTVCVCIGQVTADTLRQYTSAPILVSRGTSAGGMVQTILAHHNP